jgi:hypothetical protein
MERMLTRYETVISLYESEIDKKDTEIKELYKDISSLKTKEEMLGGAILQLQE